METIANGFSYLLTNWMTGWLGMLLYWLPLSICFVGYTLRTMENFQKDVLERDRYIKSEKLREELSSDDFNDYIRKNRDEYVSYYHPTDKIGTLIGRALVSITPVANIWAGMFDVAPRLFHRLIERIEKIFNAPLVPEIKKD
jgi:hypothetical protein